jgi:drug/metabolite transporter (DMT)-like permease
LPPAAIALVLGAAVFHSAWNLALKSEPRRLEASLLALGAAVLLSAPVLLFHPPTQLSARAWALVLLSAAFETAYLITLTAAYEVGDLSLVYPIARGSAPLLVGVTSWIFVGEALSTTEMLGVGAISAGIFSLAIDRSHDRAHKWRPVIFGLLTGLTIMGYTLCDGQGVRVADDKYGYIVWLFFLDAPALTLMCLWRRGPALFSMAAKHWKVGALGGALSMAAYGIAIYAMSQAFMAQVAALRETSVIFAAIFSALILKERFHPRRYAAVAMVALGAVLLH